MIKRLITAIIGLPIVVLVFAFGNKYIMDVLLAIVAMISMYEYTKCVGSKTVKPIKWVSYLVAALISIIHLIPFEVLPIAFTISFLPP